ncbi:MAG: hypothetical protein JRC68_02450 [Deltaproteobacteria bacterium]|nr:hypothetical protein [Deltaproteobacteria bacterium]
MPADIIEFIATFMRALNNARLYASGHDLLKKNIEQLYIKFQETVVDRDFLFLGCAKDNFFLEGSFYPAKDVHLQKFLKFFHTLRISHVLLDKEATPEELESFIGLLAGAQQGQGEEVSSALLRENIKRVKIGLIDYSIFSTVQSVTSHLFQGGEDEAVWRQLIIQPAAAGSFKLSQEKIKEFTRLTEDLEELKKVVLQLDHDIAEGQKEVSTAQRGMLLGNFIQNLGNSMASIDLGKRKEFARQAGLVLDSLEPRLKTQILGSAAPDDNSKETSDVIHEILQAMPDNQFAYLLADALKEAGAKSPCFNNLYLRALAKYKEPGLLLNLIRQEMNQAVQEEKPDHLSSWQHLEQLLIQQQETEELNKQYQQEIEALATSIQLQKPMAEEEEMAGLLKTLTPAFLGQANAKLIIDIIRQPHPSKEATFLPSMTENLGEMLGSLFSRKSFSTVGDLLHDIYLIFHEHPMEESLKKIISSVFMAKEIKVLLKYHLEKCHTYEPKETKAVDAICDLYPEKASGFLLDLLLGIENDDSPQAHWLSTTLAILSPRMTRTLSRRLEDATEKSLPRLLSFIGMSADRHMAPAVEQLLDHQNREVQLKGISTLGKLQAERSIPRLNEIISKKSWIKTKKLVSLQTAAAHALAEIGTDEAKAALREVAGQGSGKIRKLCKKLV